MVVHLDKRRIGGSAAALVVLYGIPAVFFLVEYAWPYDAGVAIAVVAAGWVASRSLWPQVGAAGFAYIGGAALIAAAVAVIGFLATYAAVISAGLCGSDGTSTPVAGSIALVPVYGVVGLWGFQHPRRVLWAWPLAIALGLLVDLAVTAAIPSAHGFCET
jgi:hypothetical protein